MLIRLIVALVVAVVISGFYAGYTQPSTSIYHPDFLAMGSFLLATIVTVLLGAALNCKSCKKSSGSSSHSKAAANYDDEDRENGSVKWFNVSKGFGFITRENGEDIFVHYRSIRGEGRRRLFDGQAVTFAVVDSDKGLQAEDVDIL